MPLLENVYSHFHHTIEMQGFVFYYLVHVTFIKNKDLLYFYPLFQVVCYK